MTIEAAAARWFEEKGSLGGDAENTRGVLDVLEHCVGKRVRLRDIDGAKISEAIARRRGLLHRGKVPANATVNRMLSRLRSIMRRARRAWGARSVPDVCWDEHFLPEPKPRAREYTDEQVTRWKGECGADAGLALECLLTYGWRFNELFFAPADVDAVGARVTIRERKADDDLSTPLLTHHARELARRAARALAEGWDTVWFDEFGRFTYWALYHRIRDAGARVGLNMGRLIHGARHHAGTRMTRVTGNLKVTQKLLGHASITSTARYAHAIEDDIRQGLEALSRNSPELAAQKRRKARKGEK